LISNFILVIFQPFFFIGQERERVTRF
jgi:hypothetical protein